ncbi:uncharacterized protein TNIN_113811 [Trichonephila inaurata madagascariensis]|uniref:Uncharacterized protein n=1 Tax=Trichonephila inaurata madagascariensis TaxID=2747483 RepID=A0A8X6YYH4_9ARAC|nr:uncharacterized protein TNIN_113811 [Trichonephila inaurata madagascariensis]
MVWREHRYLLTDCYFCMTSILGFSSKSKHTIRYPNIPSHNESSPIPVPLENYILQPEMVLECFKPPSGALTSAADDEQYLVDLINRQSNFITQPYLNDIIQDLKLPKNKNKLFVLRLQLWNLRN